MSTDVSKQRETLYELLGDLPARDRKVSAKVISSEQQGSIQLEKLSLDLNGREAVPAWFAKPAGATGKLPVILFNHSHGGFYKVGKNELLKSAPYMQPKSWAEELTSMGYAALAIDHWCFGERSTRTEGTFFRECLWKGEVMWGLMVYDSLKAMDYLQTRGDVDMARVATLGMSMGSTMAWWAAALDERIKVCVDICCLTDFHAIIESKGLEGHGVYYYVPALLKHFTTSQINALIAPRPHLALAGWRDRLTPADGLRKVDAALQRVYAAAGAKEAWKLSGYDVEHQETEGMRQETLAWLRQWL